MTCRGGGWCGLPHSPGAWAWLGLLLSWGAATPFWNSLSLLDKELSVLCSNSLGLRDGLYVGIAPCAVERAQVWRWMGLALPT